MALHCVVTGGFMGISRIKAVGRLAAGWAKREMDRRPLKIAETITPLVISTHLRRRRSLTMTASAALYA